MKRWPLILAVILCGGGVGLAADVREQPLFGRHVVAVFSRAGCNAGRCHGAVQGQNGFRLSLFGAKPADDYDAIVRQQNGRRFNAQEPEQSLLLLKATGKVPHGGGRRIETGSFEHQILRNWLLAGAPLTASEPTVASLEVSPREQAAKAGASYPLHIVVRFEGGGEEDVTALCSFTSLDQGIAIVDAAGIVTAQGVGDTAIIVRYRAEPVMAQVFVARERSNPTASIAANSFIDQHVLAKLQRLNIPAAELADDATFLRRVRLDVSGQLPTPAEVREFLADGGPNKRERKIDELLSEPGYAAVWTLKFCDLLSASDFGVYADGLAEHYEAPRFQAWIRRRLEENTPYDEFVARILTATSRDGKSREEWAEEVVALQEGYTTPRRDLDLYAQRKTLDAYWQRKGAVGVSGTLQIAHAFLGLRLECAQCHRHPHDVWQQDDLLSFANFFMGVRTVGFQGENDKKYPEDQVLFKKYTDEGKKLTEEVKQLKEGRGKELAEKAKTAKKEIDQLKAKVAKGEASQDELAPLEQTIAENDSLQREIREKEQRGKNFTDEVPKRILHAQIFYEQPSGKSQKWAKVTSPLGTQSSEAFRLLGETQSAAIDAGGDPREQVVVWLRRPDNPFFAKAIVNRVWAHYFGRGIINPPDDLSSFNPPTHPELLDELCRRFIASGYDLKWLHRAILSSRTYQQSSLAQAENAADRANHAYFYPRRLPAEVMLDVLNQTTGTTENLDMQYYHWPKGIRTVEVPYVPRNGFVAYMLEQFGRPPRNSSAQCDCARQADASLLQVLSLANHPRVWQKIADPAGRVNEVTKLTADPRGRIEELYLSTLSRLPDEAELTTCQDYLQQADSPEQGMQSVLWSLLNTKEFVLQH